MSPRKRILFIVSIVVGMLAGAFFVFMYGGPKTFWAQAEKVSWLHYCYGMLLIIVVFWMGFVGTWAACSALLWIVHRYFHPAGDKALVEREQRHLQ